VGRLRVVYFYVWSSEGGSPHLCQLRTTCLAPGNKFDYVLVHTGLWGPANLVVLIVAKLDDISPYLTNVHWDSVGATHGCPSRYRVEDLH
jgi:hypothetical protein